MSRVSLNFCKLSLKPCRHRYEDTPCCGSAATKRLKHEVHERRKPAVPAPGSYPLCSSTVYNLLYVTDGTDHYRRPKSIWSWKYYVEIQKEICTLCRNWSNNPQFAIQQVISHYCLHDDWGIIVFPFEFRKNWAIYIFLQYAEHFPSNETWYLNTNLTTQYCNVIQSLCCEN